MLLSCSNYILTNESRSISVYYAAFDEESKTRPLHPYTEIIEDSDVELVRVFSVIESRLKFELLMPESLESCSSIYLRTGRWVSHKRLFPLPSIGVRDGCVWDSRWSHCYWLAFLVSSQSFQSNAPSRKESRGWARICSPVYPVLTVRLALQFQLLLSAGIAGALRRPRGRNEFLDAPPDRASWTARSSPKLELTPS